MSSVKWCAQCSDRLWAATSPQAKYCSAACRSAAYRKRRGLSDAAGRLEYSWCAHCGEGFDWVRARAGQERLYCTAACSQAAYRQRVKDQAADRQRRKTSSSRSGGSSSTGGRRRSSAGGAGASSGTGGSSRGAGSSSSGSSSSGRAGGSSWSGSSNWHRGSSYMSTTEARRIVFELAGLADDGTTTVKTAYRKASMRHHPDTNRQADGETFKLLQRAWEVLRKAGTV